MAFTEDHSFHPSRPADNGHGPAAGPPSGGFDADVLVIGGGLAGLAAAAHAARGGARVVVLERSESVGGRAVTHDNRGYLFNVGPHALYAGGPGSAVLAELGVAVSGRRPPASGGLAFHGGGLHTLPGGFVSLLTTDLLTVSGKIELAGVLSSLPKLDAGKLRGRTLRQWLDATFRDAVVRELIEALMRLTAYANAPELSCAAASVAQLQQGLGSGVIYLDGGWATLGAGLQRAAEEAGARVLTGRRVSSVEEAEGGVAVTVRAARGSRADDGGRLRDPDGGRLRDDDGDDTREARVLRARVAVLALPPAVAAALCKGRGGDTLSAWAAAATPVKAACLDLGLARLPEPRRLFAIGVDRPLYFSVHSASARLAPEGAAVIHVAKYLPSGGAACEQGGDEVRAELEAFCDQVQPGWRTEVVESRFLPSMLVTGALVEAGKTRPGPRVPGSPSLLVTGDWVGGEGMIADTALASGSEAGRLAAGIVRAASASDASAATSAVSASAAAVASASEAASVVSASEASREGSAAALP
ncbi:MAG: FAD-dependent oxidoreductase [Candidatus Binatia bacterium]